MKSEPCGYDNFKCGGQIKNRIQNNDIRHEEKFNIVFFHNRITIATISDLNANIQELSAWVDNFTTLVEGMVGAQTSQDEVQPSVA